METNTFPKIFFLKFNPLANKAAIKPKKNMRNNKVEQIRYREKNINKKSL